MLSRVLIAPSQTASRSVSIYEKWSCDWLSLFSLPLNPSSGYPALPHSLTESQVDREVHCIYYYCLCSMQSSWGKKREIPLLLQTLPWVSHHRHDLNFKSFRNQLFLITPSAISTQDTLTVPGQREGRVLVQRFLYPSCTEFRISVPLSWLWPWHWTTVTMQTLLPHSQLYLEIWLSLLAIRPPSGLLRPIRPFDNFEPESKGVREEHWQT